MIYENPHIDLKPIIVIHNNSQFKGASLDKYTKKSQSGAIVPQFYRNGEYSKIEEYIINETNAFIELYQKLRNIIPKLDIKINK